MGEPVDPGKVGPPGLTGGPLLVKIDNRGSVSGLVRVRVPLGYIVIKYPEVREDSFGS